MNTIVLFVGIIATLAMIFAISQILQKLCNRSSRMICRVLAGDEEDHSICYNKGEVLRPFESFKINGKRIDPSKYTIARVDGECMQPCAIHSGNIVFIQKMTTMDEKKDIKDGSILYIRSKKNGTNGCYLREYIKERSYDDKVATRFYRNGIEPKDSEAHHNLEDVLGVVKYCFE